jgi:multicomponent Na+:H+ antiporter subunit A
MPVLAAASAVAAAGLSGLPLTAGFFKDELFFAAALEHGPLAIGGAVLAAALTWAYTWRWWAGIFLGPSTRTVHRVSPVLTASVAGLAAFVLAGGLAPAPVGHLSAAAGSIIAAADVQVAVAYHLAWRPEYLMALSALAIGIGVLLATYRLAPRLARLPLPIGRMGPARLYGALAGLLAHASTWLHELEVRDLRDRTAAVLVPGGLLIALALASGPIGDTFRLETLAWSDVPLISALVVTSMATLATAAVTGHLALILALSTVSYSMAIVFAMFGAPDVALVAVLIQNVLTLLLAAVLTLFRPEIVHQATRTGARTPRRFTSMAWLGGLAAFAMTWAVLSGTGAPIAAAAYADLAREAHARNVVTAILADFRGLDTMGEATVIAIALVGIAALLRTGRRS